MFFSRAMIRRGTVTSVGVFVHDVPDCRLRAQELVVVDVRLVVGWDEDVPGDGVVVAEGIQMSVGGLAGWMSKAVSSELDVVHGLVEGEPENWMVSLMEEAGLVVHDGLVPQVVVGWIDVLWPLEWDDVVEDGVSAE